MLVIRATRSFDVIIRRVIVDRVEQLFRLPLQVQFSVGQLRLKHLVLLSQITDGLHHLIHLVLIIISVPFSFVQSRVHNVVLFVI